MERGVAGARAVETVCGPVPASELGRILPHEHVVCDLIKDRPRPDPTLDESEDAVADLKEFKAAGGSTIIDCTNNGLGRNPGLLRSVSEQTGLHIVMGCGWYRESFYEEDMNKVSVAELTEILLQDIRTGVHGIRPGVIGEIGADHGYLSAAEERVLRAAARAQKETGLGLVLHAVKSDVGRWQLDVLEEEGCDLRRVAVAHCDMYPYLDYHELLAKRGALVSYDRNGPRNPHQQERRIRNMVEFIRRGWASHLLISHDVCIPGDRASAGGPGYAYVLNQVVPDLREAGVPGEVIESIMVDNPVRLLVGS
ncbi:phosphotriesterase [Spongiactinospora sp. 9N601]|uniref:phosphotriesterase n=1 Tax=Spongiactinospora sp. 9N601 TaxID=3375149 RepID=UPI0037BD0B91